MLQARCTWRAAHRGSSEVVGSLLLLSGSSTNSAAERAVQRSTYFAIVVTHLSLARLRPSVSINQRAHARSYSSSLLRSVLRASCTEWHLHEKPPIVCSYQLTKLPLPSLLTKHLGAMHV